MKEQQRLLTMLHENKITEEEYNILIQSLERKYSKFYVFLTLMVNPFEKIVGLRALILGVITLLIISFLGYELQLYSMGLLNLPPATLIKGVTISYSYWVVLYQNIVICFVISIFFLFFAKLFKCKKIRILDFFATVFFSRFPMIIALSLLWVLQVFQNKLLVSDFANGAIFKPSIESSILNVTNMICVCWQLATYYFALKASSGLNIKKLFFTAIITLIVTAPIIGYLTMWFV